MKKKTYFFFLICFFINIKFSFSNFYQNLTVNKTQENNSANWNTEETVKFSKTLDMGPCPCNLTSHCDYRCCCDSFCSDEIIKKWTDQKICKNIPKNRMESFQCIKGKKHKEEEFNYNKKNAGITVKDHISNIMCIYYDHSGDKGNFYVNEVNEENLKETRNNWIKKFFYIKEKDNNRRLQEQEKPNILKYGDIINDFYLYKPNSNGNCVPTKISYLVPFESSCNFNGTFKEENITFLKNVKNKTVYYYQNQKDRISEITYIIEYNNNDITNKTINVLRTNQTNSNIVKFKVLWKKSNINMNKKLPSGYFQGSPIKIAFNKDSKFVYFENGFFIAMNDKNNRLNCASDLSNAKNPSPILFKNNIKHSCIHNGQQTYLEQTFCNKELRLAKSPDKSVEEANSSNDWIPLYTNCPDKSRVDDISINLFILTSKYGKEHSPYEHIEYAKLDSYKKGESNGILSLSIQFVELSYSSLMNNREGKITSLIPLPEEILKNLTKK